MSKIEVNTVAPQCGTTLTLGESGDTVVLGSGASQSGFGRTGTVDWQTSIKTSTFTAANGEGYFVNTTGGAVTVNLPAGSVGAIVAIKDYAQTFDTNACTVSANGSEKIENLTADLELSTEGLAVTLVYADATRGWQAVNSNEVTNVQRFVAATGGTITTVDTNFKVHTFTSPGSFNVTCAGSSSGSNKVDYLVVAGGGGGATQHAGGGGGGGFRGSFPSPGCNAGTTTVSAQAYPITVGGGGARTPTGPNVNTPASSGGNSTWNTITSAGGGGGGSYSNPPGAGTTGTAGGSGGGGGSRAPGSTTTQTAGGAGNTPPQSSPASPVQGHAGGYGVGHQIGGGGGGGAAAVGGNANPNAGVGGAGKQNNIDSNNYYWAGGGGGGSHCQSAGAGGIGGGGGGGTESGGGAAGAGGGSAINAGGAGENGGSPNNSKGGNGGDNSGGGGGSAGNNNSNAGNGGSGIVILRYKFQ